MVTAWLEMVNIVLSSYIIILLMCVVSSHSSSVSQHAVYTLLNVYAVIHTFQHDFMCGEGRDHWCDCNIIYLNIL